MVPVVVASKTLLLYSAVPWLAGGIAVGYMGKHFTSQGKLNLNEEIKRLSEEIEQLRTANKDLDSRLSKLQASIVKSSAMNKAVKATQTLQRKVTASAPSSSKGAFLKNLVDANVRLRENISADSATKFN